MYRNSCHHLFRAGLIPLLAGCWTACTSPARNFVPDENVAGSADESGGAKNGGAKNGGETNGGASSSAATGGGTDSVVGSGGGAGTSAVGFGGSLAGGAGSGLGGALGGAPGTSGPQLGGAGGTLGSAPSGGATNGTTAIVRLGNGRVCQSDTDCQSNNCRLAPNGTRFCVAQGNSCSSVSGVGVAASASTCDANQSVSCTATDSFQRTSCLLSNEVCASGICDNATGNCARAPANPGAICAQGSTTGACDGGVCATLRFVPPVGRPWTPIGMGPLTNVPPDCGTLLGPHCADGEFKFELPPDTRQLKCYSDSAEVPCPGVPGSPECERTAFCGQDAQYGMDVTKPNWSTGRFVTAGSSSPQVVLDGITGLVWTFDSIGEMQMPWAKAQQFCSNKTTAALGGYSDWVMPSIYALFSLYDFGIDAQPGTASLFPSLQPNYVWSASTTAFAANSTWFVGMGIPAYVASSARLLPESQSIFTARCTATRALASIAAQRYFVSPAGSGEALIFDSRTGLAWPQTQDTTGRNWAGALSFCQSLVYAGRDDWRAANVIELESLVDYTRQNPAIDTGVFPNTSNGFYWTSTTVASSPSMAWAIRFQDGALALWESAKAGAVTSSHPVRCVTGGPM